MITGSHLTDRAETVSDLAVFPWWLWVLAGLWAAAVVGQRRIPATSDWRRSLQGLAAVYTLLLVYLGMRAVVPFEELQSTPLLRQILCWIATSFTLGGALIAIGARRPTFAAAGQSFGFLGLAGLAGLLSAWELTLLCLAAAIICGLRARSQPFDVSQHEASQHAAATDAVPSADGIRLHPLPIVASVALVCVFGIGLLQYGTRAEARRPSASRWFTALPAPETIARRRDTTAPHTTLVLEGLLLTAALLWMQHRRSAPVVVTHTDSEAIPDAMLSTSLSDASETT